jgi:hypothetical protein
MKAFTLISYFNSLNGQKNVSKDTLNTLRVKIQRYTDSVGHGPYMSQLRDILTRLGRAVASMDMHQKQSIDRLEVKPVKVIQRKKKVTPPKPLAKPEQKPEPKTTVKKKKPVVKKIKAVRVKKARLKVVPEPKPKAKQLPATGRKSISGINYDYKEVVLGPYKNDFHRMFTDTIVQIHGLPGHGKTVWLLKYAQYRAELGDKVLYVAREEYGRSVFDMKLKEHNIGHPNLRFDRKLNPADMQWATVIFLDSVSALKLSHEDVEELSIEYPNRNWNIVLQSTKDGDFRGTNEWEHLVDIAGEIRNRKLILRKNRLDPNNSLKAEKLKTESAITEAKKKEAIRKAVKDSMKPKAEPQKQAA